MRDPSGRLSTGGGYATRQLHTDRDETIFSAQRPIVLNGISDLATRGDLAERVLSITLPPLADDRRREEREFWAAFDQALPQILGALLDAVAAGLRRLPDTILKRRPRMADFATWVEACSAGFGWGEGQFLRDYEENCSDVVAAAAEASPLVPAIEAVLGRGGLLADGFDGTSSELLTKLNQVCSETERKARWYPTNASQVGSALRRVGPLLKSRGIEFPTYYSWALLARNRHNLLDRAVVELGAIAAARATRGPFAMVRRRRPHPSDASYNYRFSQAVAVRRVSRSAASLGWCA